MRSLHLAEGIHKENRSSGVKGKSPTIKQKFVDVEDEEGAGLPQNSDDSGHDRSG